MLLFIGILPPIVMRYLMVPLGVGKRAGDAGAATTGKGFAAKSVAMEAKATARPAVRQNEKFIGLLKTSVFLLTIEYSMPEKSGLHSYFTA